jgi:hypothetical protein
VYELFASRGIRPILLSLERDGKSRRGRCRNFHAPLYISSVILYTKQTWGVRENNVTARG